MSRKEETSMKIFEFGNGGGDLLEPSLRGGLERSSRWERPAPASAPSTAGSLLSDTGRRTINVGTSGKLKLHVLDLGKLRLDKNFMVANTTVATARTPNPRGQVIDIPVSAYYDRACGRKYPVRHGLQSELGRTERTLACRRAAGALSAYRRRGVSAPRAARHDGRRPGRRRLCRPLTFALRPCGLRRIFPQVEDHRA